MCGARTANLGIIRNLMDVARLMRTDPAVPFVLAALATCALFAPARAQVPTAPIGISPVEEPAVTAAQVQPAPALTLAQAVLLSPHEPSFRATAAETYAAGNWELQFLAGGYFRSSLGPAAPDFDYLPISVRVGYIWTPPPWEGSRWLGNLETLLELTAAPIASGPGNIVIGPSLILRRNIMSCPEQRCVPYIQAGAGIIYTDAGNDHTQGAVGQEMEFLLQAQLGWRTRLGRNWTFDIEAGYQHISNAGIATHNGGVNEFGASIGFTYSLPCRR